MLCNAYGKGSSICTGANTQYDLDCGDEEKARMERYHREASLSELGEGNEAQDVTQERATQQEAVQVQATIGTANGTIAVDLQDALDPLLGACDASFLQSKEQCETAIQTA